MLHENRLKVLDRSSLVTELSIFAHGRSNVLLVCSTSNVSTNFMLSCILFLPSINLYYILVERNRLTLFMIWRGQSRLGKIDSVTEKQLLLLMIIIRLRLRIIIYIEFFNVLIGGNIKYFHFQFQLFNYSKFMKNIEDILQIFSYEILLSCRNTIILNTKPKYHSSAKNII